MIKKIEIPPLSTIDSVVETLLEAKARGESVYAEFYGHKLYSDTITLESAYLEMTGKTEIEHKKDLEKRKKEFLEEATREGRFVFEEIKVSPLSTIDSVVETLLEAKARGESVYIMFEGHKLCSDTITPESAYLQVTGKTEIEYKKDLNRQREEYKKDFEKWQKEYQTEQAILNIPYWTERGQRLIYPERYQEWEKWVNNRARDLYYGADLEVALEIMQIIENGATIEEATNIFEKQVHADMPNSMIRKIIFNFSSKGPEFWEATSSEEMSLDEKKAIEEKKAENLRFAELYPQEKSVGKGL